MKRLDGIAAPGAQKEQDDLGPRRPKNHHVVTTALGAGAEADDPDTHRRGTTTAHDMEEARDPNPQYTYMTMKTMK
jgi:hypothetical protein